MWPFVEQICASCTYRVFNRPESTSAVADTRLRVLHTRISVKGLLAACARP